jgi:hypothetical protein
MTLATNAFHFINNGYFLGTAFRDVESGYNNALTPSLDLWFENGSVELLSNDKPSPKEYL